MHNTNYISIVAASVVSVDELKEEEEDMDENEDMNEDENVNVNENENEGKETSLNMWKKEALSNRGL